MNSRLPLLIVLLTFASTVATASTEILSRDYGFNGTDDTEALTTALRTTTADTLIVDRQVSPWISRPILVSRNDLVILFEPGAVVRQKSGAFGDDDKLFRFVFCENITILGYGASVLMNREEFNDGSAHSFSLNACTNFRIEGLTIRGSGGDGIIVTRVNQGGQITPSRNVTIRNCWLDQHLRQGISVINVDGLLIEGCRMSNTRGSLPQSGIDFESDNPEEMFKNCVVRNCLIDGNAGRGIQLGLGKLNANSEPVDITFEDIVVRGNGTSPISGRWGGVTFNTNDDGVSGQVTFRRLLFEDEPAYGARIKAVSNLGIVFDQCVWRNVGNEYDPNVAEARDYLPVLIERRFSNTRITPIGNITFDNCVVEDDVDRPTLRIIGSGDDSPVEDIVGEITLINPALSPNTSVYEFGPASALSNVTLSNTVRDEWPASAYTLTTPGATATEGGNNGRFEIVQSGDATIPIPVAYSLGGSAINRTDYTGLPGAQVIPGNEGSATITIRAETDLEDESSETVILSLVNDPAYTLGNPTEGTVTIGGSGEPEPTDELGVTVRARGNVGGEQFQLYFNGNPVGNVRTVTTEMADYVFNSVPSNGIYRVAYINDTLADLDLQIDYLKAGEVVMQAEDQLVNTGAWNSEAQACGGVPSEWLRCEGYIEFGGAASQPEASYIIDTDQQSVWPNPASSFDQVQLRITTKVSSAVEVFIHDAQGQLVRSAQANARPGVNHIDIPVRGLRTGLYSISARYASGQIPAMRLIVK